VPAERVGSPVGAGMNEASNMDWVLVTVTVGGSLEMVSVESL
jgi:hypothetical protein